MPTSQPVYPTCNSTHTVKNGFVHNGKQSFKCRNCRRSEAERLRLHSLCMTYKTKSLLVLN
ncbi:IS1/IS1595 family N-terminal zinc-binding domain-containing protein [Chroococcidiopsis cubana]|uniref:IS1/IS1595 family N-terminal zinc-binding domain-containing protein n=1 Tax=Chroococcidiopsis cubana TaxID=171392 RepID=UPI003BAFFE0F